MLPRLTRPGSIAFRAPTPAVTMAEVRKDLVEPSGAKAESELAKWAKDRAATAPTLSGYVHRRIFDIHPDQVTPLLTPGLDEWPFPKGTRKRDWAIKAVDDMTTGIPLILAMHGCVEKMGRVPSWKEAVAWMNTPAMHPHFLQPAWVKWNTLPAAERPDKDAWMRAMRWRLGNAYLSFLREADFLARMRKKHNVDLRYHIVADAVFRADFWIGRNLVCLWMPNDYRERKKGPLHYMGDEGRFTVHDVVFSTTPPGWAAVTTVSEEDAAQTADAIKAVLESAH